MFSLPQGPKHSAQGDQEDQPQFTEGGPRARSQRGAGAQLGGLGEDEGPLEEGQGQGLTGTVWVGPTALESPVLAGAELAVSLDALARPVRGAIQQAGALPGPHTPPVAAQHLACRAPAA